MGAHCAGDTTRSECERARALCFNKKHKQQSYLNVVSIKVLSVNVLTFFTVGAAHATQFRSLFS